MELKNKDYPINNSEENIIENKNTENERMELKFSCGEDRVSEYLEDGWIILKEDTQEKFALGNLYPPQKIVIWEKIKVATNNAR